jgi:hypothetical protein
VAPVLAAGQCTASHEYAMSPQLYMEDESFLQQHSNNAFRQFSEQVQITQLQTIWVPSTMSLETPSTNPATILSLLRGYCS